ncbi:hypothetical protein FRB93_008774 [Tulasnella sp. JGI-2019a]|nr:hypothetical protein FRB93_008774 [Tulasnella sp. JGI-2019a]
MDSAPGTVEEDVAKGNAQFQLKMLAALKHLKICGKTPRQWVDMVALSPFTASSPPQEESRYSSDPRRT